MLYGNNIIKKQYCQDFSKTDFTKTINIVDLGKSGNTNYIHGNETEDFESQKDRSFLSPKQKAALINGAFNFDCITDKTIKIEKLKRIFCTVTDHSQDEAKHSSSKKIFNKLMRQKYNFEYVAKTEIRKTTKELHTHFEFFIELTTKEEIFEFIRHTKACWNETMIKTIPDNEFWETEEKSIIDNKEHSKPTYNAAGLRKYFSKFPETKEYVVSRPWTASKGIKSLMKYVTINLFDKRKKVGIITISARNSVKVKMFRTEHKKSNNIIAIKKTQTTINLHLYFEKFRKKLPYLINQKYQFGFTAMNRAEEFLEVYPEIKNVIKGMNFFNCEQTNMELIRDSKGVIKLITRAQANTKRKIA